MIYYGSDPDNNTPCIASIREVNGRLRIEEMRAMRPIKGLRDRDARIQAILLTYGMVQDLPADIPSVIAVEGQEIVYTAASGKNPRSMIGVAQVAGAVLGVVAAACVVVRAYIPSPVEWKGNVPKGVHQARIFKRLGWECETRSTNESKYCRPIRVISPDHSGAIDFAKIQALEENYGITVWRHMADAIGLAFYAYDTYQAEQRRASRLKQGV